MKRKNLLSLLLIMILSGVFLALNSVYAMPVGTLLYRTSRDGEMFGYNTDQLFQLLDISLDKGIETMKINCGHVGMYAGKINGQDMVLEAINNGVQLTPAKYFIDTREGEKFVGARIPKVINSDEMKKINLIASAMGNLGLKYDWGFSDQKGPESGQWICVGLTEKIYESLTPLLTNEKIISDNVLRKLIYDPSKYAINITPDGFDNTSVYDKSTGDCLATKKEFSKIARRDWEPAYVLGKITDQGRYFFLPYTQFIQPTLQDVKVDIPLASDFDAEKIRGKQPIDKIILVAITNTVIKKPVETAANIYLALVANTLSAIFPLPPEDIVKQELAQAASLFFSGYQQTVASSANQINQSGKVLAAVDNNSLSSLNNLLAPNEARAAEDQEAAPADDSAPPAAPIIKRPDAVITPPAPPAAPAVNQDDSGDFYVMPPSAGTAIINPPPINPAPISAPLYSGGGGYSSGSAVNNQNQGGAPVESSAENLDQNQTADNSADSANDQVIEPTATGTAPLIDQGTSSPAIDNPRPSTSSPESTSTPPAEDTATSTAPAAVTEPTATSTESVATTTEPIATSSTPDLKPAPIIESFSLADQQSRNNEYTNSQTAALETEIENADSVQKYYLDEPADNAANQEITWLDVLPADYNLSQGDGEKTVRLNLRYNDTEQISASASIFLDTAAPTAKIINLPKTSGGSSLPVNWQGSDDSGSGIADYEIDYAADQSSSTQPGDWQIWLSDTSATSSIFDQAVVADNYLFFRVRAIDRAGNQGPWSQSESVKITPADKVLISEFVTTGPKSAYDEFVELYNPGGQSIDLSGWRLQSRSATASSSWVNRTGAAGLPSGNIPARGYFLIAAKDYARSAIPDYRHTANWGLADSGGSLRVMAANGKEVDEVSYGKAAAAGSDLSSADFSQGLAAERKAFATSTSATMILPGAHSLAGNGFDTDNDSDFVVNAQADPQNSSSLPEPADPARIIPGAVADLAVDSTYSATDSVRIIWSSARFGNLAAGAKYVLKYEIASGACDLATDWNTASSAAESLISAPPALSGISEQAIIGGLKSNTAYCFALTDFNGYNYSGLSDLASGQTKKVIVPIKIGSINYKLSERWCWELPSFALAHTVAAGNDRILIFALYGNSAFTDPKVNFSGQEMTLAKTAAASNYGTYISTSIYYLKNPPVGAGTINFEGHPGEFMGGMAIDASNVDLAKLISTSTPQNFTYSASFGTAINPTVDNSLSIEAIAIPDNQTDFIALSGQQTIAAYQNNSPFHGFLVGSAYKTVNSGNQILSWQPKPEVDYSTAAQNIFVIQPED
ncbi:MAG TPA: lamin tail domain-containing protein [Candidatus Nanoarchaeia archaeon]|nr:lamin tail domain-containing protein [Candidatus Nanoarchaeia archaeon]